ncbi:MAG: metallophosphoesterase [Roseinatronobacter sp.]
MARLLHLTDLHVVAPGALCSGVLDTGAILRTAVDRLLAQIPAIGPLDGLLVTGDISEDGSAASYDLAQRELARFDLPVYAVPGNHDSRGAFRVAFGGQDWMPASGLIDWVVDLPDTRLIGLDTLVEGQGAGRVSPDSLEFLNHALQGAGGRALIVALHHPPLRTGIRFMDNIGLENSKDLAATIPANCQPVTFVAGHVHGVYLGRIGAHRVVTAPSLCSAFALDRRADAIVGFLSGPTGYALLDTGPDDSWTAQPFCMGDGPFEF